MTKKPNTNLWRKHNFAKDDLRSGEQYCCECYERASYLQPCPVCRGRDAAKEVQVLPEIETVKYVEIVY